METALKHNYEFCNTPSARCVHCCSLDYNLSRDYYEALFSQRRKTFDMAVKNFPTDLGFYVKLLEDEQVTGGLEPCDYLGMVDKNPGCMIHPSRHNGQEIRADDNITKANCSPQKGCYFNNYFKTAPERKILSEFLAQASDWFSYSKSLRDCAVFNKQTGYVSSRLPLWAVSVKSVDNIMEHIHARLKEKFPREERKPIVQASDIDIQAIIDEEARIGPTEKYMQDSSSFQKWGYRWKHFHFRGETPCVERRFKPEDFSEWGYFWDTEREMHIHIRSGEILPLQFDDVAITSDEQVKKAMRIVNGVIGSYCKRKK